MSTRPSRPDILTAAKALGGGIPMGAMLATESVAASFTPGDARLDLRRHPLCRGGGSGRGHHHVGGEAAGARGPCGPLLPGTTGGAEGEARDGQGGSGPGADPGAGGRRPGPGGREQVYGARAARLDGRGPGGPLRPAAHLHGGGTWIAPSGSWSSHSRRWPHESAPADPRRSDGRGTSRHCSRWRPISRPSARPGRRTGSWRARRWPSSSRSRRCAPASLSRRE